MQRLRADLLLLLSAFFWGTAFLGQKEAVGDLGALTIVGGRFLLAALLIVPLAWHESRRTVAALTRRDWWQTVAIGLCIAAGAGLEQQGLVTTSITNAGFLTSLYVVMVPFLVWALTRQAPRPLVLLACAICVAGAWLLAQHGVTRRWTLGDIQVVMADFFWASSIALIALFLQRTERPFFLTFATYATTAVLGLALGSASGTITASALTAALPGTLYAGLCGGIAGSLQIVAQKHTPAAEAGLIMALQSVFAALAGAWFLNELLTPAAALGCGLILLGVVLVEAGPVLLRGFKNVAARRHQAKLSPIEFAQSRSKEITAFLAERIYEFNSNATGLFDGEEFAATIKDSGGRIIAAVDGHTWGGCCQVSQLWVHESARQQGLGRSLMLAVEAHALARDCTQVVLSSHSFQAPDFYRRLGYVEQARIPGYPNGHSDIHFMKYVVKGRPAPARERAFHRP